MIREFLADLLGACAVMVFPWLFLFLAYVLN